MEYAIRPARPEDVAAIMAVMESAMGAMTHPEWFYADDDGYIARHIDSADGFCLVAEAPDGTLAAYFTVKYAGTRPDALGWRLGMTGQQLLATAQMDSCCVAPAHQGHGLEGKLILAAEDRLRALPGHPIAHLVGTVHPDNAPSLTTALHRGYVIAAASAPCYGANIRHILRKELEVSQ